MLNHLTCILVLFALFCSILGYVLPLQEVAFDQSPPNFSVLCSLCPYHPLSPYVILSNSILVFQLISYPVSVTLCLSYGPYIVFHSGNVSSLFRFCVALYILEYVCQCHSGSLPGDGVKDSVLYVFF